MFELNVFVQEIRYLNRPREKENMRFRLHQNWEVIAKETQKIYRTTEFSTGR